MVFQKVTDTTRGVGDYRIPYSPFFTKEKKMLVLGRKQYQEIVIDDVIVVSILSTRGDKVQVGIEAPKEISIYRRETWEKIQQRKNAQDD